MTSNQATSMKLLMIDTSSIVATAAVLKDSQLMCETIVNYKKKHSEKMMPAIDHMLKDAGLTIQEMDAFGIVIGPGSFTGIRIGLATVKGLAQALNKPVVAVNALEGLAYNLPYTEGLIYPILDAQRNEGYTAGFTFKNGQMHTVMQAAVLPIEEMITQLKATKADAIYLLGDGVDRFYDSLQAAGLPVKRVKAHLTMNRASSSGQLAMERLLAGKTTDFYQVEPLYLRKSYAEEHKKNG